MSERSPHSEPTYTDTSNSRLAQNSSTVFRNILTIAQEQQNQWLSRYFSSPIKLRVLLFYLEMLFACFMVRLLQIHKLVNWICSILVKKPQRGASQLKDKHICVMNLEDSYPRKDCTQEFSSPPPPPYTHPSHSCRPQAKQLSTAFLQTINILQ